MKEKLIKGLLLTGITLFVAACAPETSTQRQIASVDDWTSADQIIGGSRVSAESSYAESIVGLYNLSDSSLCTGSILSESFVVTAAHCVPDRAKDLIVFFGTDIETATITRRVDRINVTKIWGSRFEETTDWGDVAVLRLTQKIPVGYKPAKLLSSSYKLQKGMTVTLAGYGITNGAAKTGSGQLRTTTVQIEAPLHGKTEVLFNQTKGRGACHGDSGGPAFVLVGDSYHLFGVTSRGHMDDRDDCSRFAIYSNLNKYRSFLVASMR